MRTLGAAAERIVPTMAVVYIVAAIVVLVLHAAAVPVALAAIVRHAFELAAGLAGATVLAALRYGVACGIFSNEAGLGSASIAHAQARNTPGGQGLWGIWEVAIDTLVIGTMTALVILVTGVLESGATGAELASRAYATALPGIGGIIVLLSLVLFSYTTMLTWGFYGEQSFRYLFGRRAVLPYRLVFLGFIYIGAIGGLVAVWEFADTLNGLMAAPNLIALIALAGVVVREKTRFLRRASDAVWVDDGPYETLRVRRQRRIETPSRDAGDCRLVSCPRWHEGHPCISILTRPAVGTRHLARVEPRRRTLGYSE